MDDNKVWSGFSMTVRRNVARAIATVLGALVVLVAALQGTALAAGPELTIAQPESPSANQTPLFNGTTTDLFDSLTSEFDPITLDIYQGPSAAGSPVQTWTADESTVEGAWEIMPTTPLPQGEYTAAVEQTNWETGTGTSDPVTFTVETRPVVTLTSPEEGAVLKTSDPTLAGGSGSAPWDGPVTVTIREGSPSGNIVASGSASMDGGSWLYTPHLSDGIYTAQASQGDEVGDAGTSPAVSFTVDAHSPTVTLTSPEEGALVTGSDPTLTGLAAGAAWDEPAVMVTIHEGGSLNGEVIALEDVPVSDGAWAYAVPHLGDGIYTAQATQGDEAGHTGTSNAVTFTVDTAAPVVTLTSPTERAFVKTSTPTLSGQGGAAPWDASRLTVKIHEGASTAGSVVASSTSVSVKGGIWSYAPSHLSDGIYTAQAEQVDEAGHDGVSNAVTFTVDTTPPALTLETPQDDEVLATSRPTFSGLAGHSTGDRSLVTVKLYKGSSVSGSPTQTLTATPEGGTWTTSASGPALANGVYTALAEQSDEAGNRTERTATFTIATNSPKVTLETPGFEVREAHLLAGATPSFSGSGGTAPEDGKVVTVKLYSGTSASGSPVRTVEGPVTGSNWKAGPVEALPDGMYTAQAEQTDTAPSSQAGVSSAVTFTIDQEKPVVTLTSPEASAFLSTPTPTLSGTAGAAAWDEQVSVAIHKGNSVDGELAAPLSSVPATAGSWSYLAPHLEDGTYTAQAEQHDWAGHKGESSAVTFTVDTTLPALTLETPEDGEQLTTSRPTFSGLAGDGPGDRPAVTVKIYRGGSVSGNPIVTPSATVEDGAWTTGPIGTALSNGTYTAVAEQSDEAGGRSERVAIFSVEVHPPQVTMTSPVNGSTTYSSSETVSGNAGTEPIDLAGITVRLYAGSTVTGQSSLEAVSVVASAGAWSAAFGGLSPGTYTAQAEQSDELGNIGRSEPATFTVLAPAAPAITTPSPPTASFKWIPANPQAGEPVTLASSSTAGSSPIVSYAWSLAGNGVFTHGESTLTTVFATPGSYTVQLRVTDANGLSSTVAEKVAVATAAIPLMQPFPVVRMAGSFSRSGAKISLLAALAPVGANVTITCHGKGCPTKSQGFVAAAGAKSKSGTVQIKFKRFERFLHSGIVVEIWISKHGQIGKFTRFVIHAGKSPTRVDQCLNPAGTTPIVCPS
jgi:Bacterial Ig-like domain/PKD domain